MAKSSFNNVRIQLKNDTSENWKNSTLVLLAGEFAVENDTGLFKIGNGTDVFSALPYANDAAQVAKEFNELKDKIGTIPDDKTIIQLIKEAATSGGPEYDDSALKKRISDNEAAIAALTGDGDGSVAKTVKDAVEAAQATLQGNIDKKVDKVEGKGLSTNDYTTDEKTKLEGIADGAQVNVIETVKVNGVALTPADKAVDVTVPTGALANKDEVAETDLADTLATKINGKLDASEVTGDLLTHNASEFAAAGHNHDTVYSKLDHNHKIEALEQTDYIIFDCGSASTVISTPTV